MRPFFSSADVVNRRSRDAKFPGKRGFSFARSLASPDFAHVFLCQLGMIGRPFGLPSFSNLVSVIGGNITNRKMSRVKAFGIVATVAQAVRAIQVKAFEKVCRQAMSQNKFAIHHQLPITRTIQTAGILPTVRFAINRTARQQSFFWCAVCCKTAFVPTKHAFTLVNFRLRGLKFFAALLTRLFQHDCLSTDLRALFAAKSSRASDKRRCLLELLFALGAYERDGRGFPPGGIHGNSLPCGVHRIKRNYETLTDNSVAALLKRWKWVNQKYTPNAAQNRADLRVVRA